MRQPKLKREFFGLFGSKDKKEEDKSPKLNIVDSYLVYPILLHFYKKETVSKISAFYKMIDKDVKMGLDDIMKSSKNPEERELSDKVLNQIKKNSPNYFTAAKALHSYNVAGLRKYGVYIDKYIDKDSYLIGMDCDLSIYLVDSLAGMKKRNITDIISFDRDFIRDNEEVEIDNSIKPLQKISTLEELKKNLDKLEFKVGDIFYYKDLEACGDAYTALSNDEFEDIGYNWELMGIFYSIIDQGYYMKNVSIFEDRKEVEGDVKGMLSSRIDKDLIKLRGLV